MGDSQTGPPMGGVQIADIGDTRVSALSLHINGRRWYPPVGEGQLPAIMMRPKDRSAVVGPDLRIEGFIPEAVDQNLCPLRHIRKGRTHRVPGFAWV